MNADNKGDDLEIARKIMDDFALRTGLSGTEGNTERRYLWTDAFAVQAFFALSHTYNAAVYHEYALNLVENVHHILGRHRNDDVRTGWISGLSEAEGKEHPTKAGLRIGKELPERKQNEPLDQRLEWERDGQYFHYLTRWVNALLQTSRETGITRYASWAAELSQAGAKFIDKEGHHMYWKMSIDLSRPLVRSMGAHDPMEGLVCAITAQQAAPQSDLKEVINDMRKLCTGRDWYTTDPLGIGGLLLNTARVTAISTTGVELPDDIKPHKLWDESLRGLKVYAQHFNAPHSASQRLAFRECGLSLGVRALNKLKDSYAEEILRLDELDKFVPLADTIEAFWSNPNNQRYSSWKEHLDINEVTLACSIVAKFYSEELRIVKSM